MKSSGNLFVVTAPSGAGKTSLIGALLAGDPKLKLSISFTTRPPRPGEVNGLNYHFVTEAEFIKRNENGDFLEQAKVHGSYYGTSRKWVEQQLQSGEDILLELDWQGAAQVRQLFAATTSIFILPPSVDALKNRLHNRGQDSSDVIALRIANARDELSHVNEFDYVIINDSFDVALQDLQCIIRSHRLKVDRQLQKYTSIINGLT